MSIYANLPKLGRVKLPSGTEYALTDADLRLMIAPAWASGASYQVGDYVRYDSNPYTSASADPFHASDDLYKCITAIASASTGDFSGPNPAWEKVTVADELKDIWDSISSAINYKGKTTTSLKDGSTTNPIIINGNAYTATPGDLVIETPPTYAANTEYHRGEYFKKDGIIYQVEQDFTAPASGDLPSSAYINIAPSEPEFIFDGTYWNEFGSMNPDGLGDLAYKDTAQGTYVKPTGAGSVDIVTYSGSTKKLSTTTITGTNGTLNATYISSVASATFAVAASSDVTVALASASNVTVATASASTVTVAIAAATDVSVPVASSAVQVGNADVGTAIDVGTSLTGTTTFVTEAIKSATLGGTTTFNTNAIKSASLTGTTTFTTSGITTSVDGDCLMFSTAATASVGISTENASTATVTISTSSADTASVSLGKTSITPAKALSTTSKSITPINGSTTITPVGNTATITPVGGTITITPVGGTKTITPVSGTASAITTITSSTVTPAKVATSSTTVATGGLENGNDILVSISSATASATVTVGTTNGTVTVS